MPNYVFKAAPLVLLVTLQNVCAVPVPVRGNKSNPDDVGLLETFSRQNLIVSMSPTVSISNSGFPGPYTSNGYISLINKIHSRFDQIFFNWEENSIVPLAAARYNNRIWKKNITIQQSTSLSPIQVWVFLRKTKSQFNDLQSEPVSLVAKLDRANTVYQGTIPVIIFDSKIIQHDVSFSKTDYIVRQVSAVLRNNSVSQFHYKIAARFHISNCGFSTYGEYIHEPLLKFVDILVFFLFPSNTDFKRGVNATLEKYILKFSKCQETLKSLKQFKVQVAFQTSWPDTTSQWETNGDYNGLVTFWQKMNHWAAQTNTVVIINQAFDQPAWTLSIQWQTNGWWRLVENKSYTQPENFVFEEKRKLLGKPAWMQEQTDNLLWLREDPTFSKDHVVVRLNPFVSSFDFEESYNLAAINVLLKQVATKFRKLVVYLSTTSIETQIPELVAKFNKNNPSKPSLRLALRFLKDTAGSNHSSNPHRYPSLERALKTVEITNSEFPGTVEQFIVSLSNYNISLVNSTKEYLKHVKSSARFLNVSVGIVLREWTCAPEETFMALVYPLLYPRPVVDTIVFTTKYSSDDTLALGAERKLTRHLFVAESCKDKVQNITDGQVDTVLGTGWPNPKDDESLMLDLVWYWEKLNEWAIATNTTVMMTGAFDNPSKDEFFGWWRLKNYDHFVNPSEYAFESKKEVLYKSAIQRGLSLLNESFTESDTHTTPVSIVIIAGVLVATVMAAIAIGWVIRSRAKSQVVQLTEEDVHHFFHGEVGHSKGKPFHQKYRENFEIPIEDIQLGPILGSGNFGVVHKAKIGSNMVEAAVKLPNRDFVTLESFRSMLMEVKILCHVGIHENVVKFIGACTSDIRNGMVYVVTEFCENGSLLSYIHTKKAPMSLISCYELYRFCYEIASGMNFLSSPETNIVHGDLCARNILLDGNYTCKVADFGLSRKLNEKGEYVKESNGVVPWRWMALESLKENLFTSQSDVWSYGVTLWEIFSLGDTPYLNLEPSGLIQALESGTRLECPAHASEIVFRVMKNCWLEKAEERPSFKELTTIFADFMKLEYADI